MFFVTALAETNRHPFDLPEAEAELVSGYNVEYSAMGFALFSLGEYANMLLMSAFNVILFFGGWLPPFAFLSFIPGAFWFAIKICFFVIFSGFFLFFFCSCAPSLNSPNQKDIGPMQTFLYLQSLKNNIYFHRL